MRSLPIISALPLLALLAAGADKDFWGQFRGPNGSGVDEALGYPAEFSPSKNLLWKVAVPYSQSSPIVAGGRVFLTGSEDGQLITLCFDAKSGASVWRKEIRPAGLQEVYYGNDRASPTPAADEHGVVVFFPDFGVVAYAPGGQQIWAVRLGPFRNFYGMAASPILVRNLVILVCDQRTGSYLIALDRRTGQTKWRTERPAATNGWATPMIFRPVDRPEQLIVLGTERLDSYYPATGEPRWWMPVGSLGSMGVPVAAGSTLFVSTRGSIEPWMRPFEAVLNLFDKDEDGRLSRGEFRANKSMYEHFGWIDTDGDDIIDAAEWNTARNIGIGEFGAFAIRPGDAQGRLEPHMVLWRFRKNIPYVPAPLLYQNVFYLVRDGGIITSLDPASGQPLKEGRSPDALGGYYASPVAADGKVYLADRDGRITVLRAAGQWEVLAVNDIDEEIHATPALHQGRIYVRTRSSIYCFGSSAN